MDKLAIVSLEHVKNELLGISIGALSMIVPLYHSEIAETQFRGRITTLQQFAVTFGIAISFWVNVSKYTANVYII